MLSISIGHPVWTRQCRSKIRSAPLQSSYGQVMSGMLAFRRSAPPQLRAAKVHPVVDLQIEYSLASRKPEREIFPRLEELGISATLYGIFSRGLLTGSKPGGKTDFRTYFPRFASDNQPKNNEVVSGLKRFALDLGITPGQLLIAWA